MNVWRRFALFTIILPCLPVIPAKFFDWARNPYYSTTTSFVASYAVLLNVPSLLRAAHKAPITFDDLNDEKAIDPRLRERFQSIFIFTLQICTSLIVSGLCYYYTYTYKNSQLSMFEVFGVVGGFVSLLRSIESGTATVLLACLNYAKHSGENNSLKKSMQATSG